MKPSLNVIFIKKASVSSADDVSNLRNYVFKTSGEKASFLQGMQELLEWDEFYVQGIELRRTAFTKGFLEILTDIAYMAGEAKYYSGNSREDIDTFTEWAKEFESNNEHTDWEETDYLLSMSDFIESKLPNTNER